MADLSRLVVKVVSEGVKEAKEQLQGLTAAGKEAEAQTKRLETACADLNRNAQQTLQQNERVRKSMIPDAGDMTWLRESTGLFENLRAMFERLRSAATRVGFIRPPPPPLRR
jgi:hypothetical protein